jgi:hypothetical protein
MKTKAFFAASALSLAMAPITQADVTINITGSTAFRAVTHQAILNAMTGETAAWEGTSPTLGSANKACFKGSVAGITGTTTVNCNWSGSVTGMAAVGAGVATSGWIDPDTATFASATASPFGNVYAVGAAPKTSVIPTVACSDVYQASTTVSAALDDVIGGVIPFKMVASESAPVTLTNITDQLHEALWVQGSQQQSLFTGNAADTNLVYAVGRDAGSGTRVTRLAETRYGIAKPVTQWRVTTSSGVASDVRLWPSLVEEATAPSNMANDPTQQGNGGYTSGSVIATIMGSTSASVNIRDAANTILVGGQNVCFISHLGLSDAATAIAAGAKELTYNGAAYTQDNVRNGKYTDWGYLHVLNKTAALTADQGLARNAIITAFGTSLLPFGATVEAGIDVSTMAVSRSEDGGLVGP